MHDTELIYKTTWKSDFWIWIIKFIPMGLFFIGGVYLFETASACRCFQFHQSIVPGYNLLQEEDHLHL